MLRRRVSHRASHPVRSVSTPLMHKPKNKRRNYSSTLGCHSVFFLFFFYIHESCTLLGEMSDKEPEADFTMATRGEGEVTGCKAKLLEVVLEIIIRDSTLCVKGN